MRRRFAPPHTIRVLICPNTGDYDYICPQRGKNETHNSDIDGVEVCLIDDLQTELVQEFYQNYQHISTNSQDYEIFC